MRIERTKPSPFALVIIFNIFATILICHPEKREISFAKKTVYLSRKMLKMGWNTRIQWDRIELDLLRRGKRTNKTKKCEVTAAACVSITRQWNSWNSSTRGRKNIWFRVQANERHQNGIAWKFQLGIPSMDFFSPALMSEAWCWLSAAIVFLALFNWHTHHWKEF